MDRRKLLFDIFKHENDAVDIKKYAVNLQFWRTYDDYVIFTTEKIPQLLTALDMGLFELPIPDNIHRIRFNSCHAILVEHNVCVDNYLAYKDYQKVQQFLASKKRCRVGVIATMHALKPIVGRDAAKIIVRVVWMNRMRYNPVKKMPKRHWKLY